jgi:hypothetical protein
MAKRKTPRLNARKWEDVYQSYDEPAEQFEKLRHHRDTDKSTNRDIKRKQQFHRSRWG